MKSKRGSVENDVSEKKSVGQVADTRDHCLCHYMEECHLC